MGILETLEKKGLVKEEKKYTADMLVRELYEEVIGIQPIVINDTTNGIENSAFICPNIGVTNYQVTSAVIELVTDNGKLFTAIFTSNGNPSFEEFKDWCRGHVFDIERRKHRVIHMCIYSRDPNDEIPKNGGKGVDLTTYFSDVSDLVIDKNNLPDKIILTKSESFEFDTEPEGIYGWVMKRAYDIIEIIKKDNTLEGQPYVNFRRIDKEKSECVITFKRYETDTEYYERLCKNKEKQKILDEEEQRSKLRDAIEFIKSLGGSVVGIK